MVGSDITHAALVDLGNKLVVLTDQISLVRERIGRHEAACEVQKANTTEKLEALIERVEDLDRQRWKAMGFLMAAAMVGSLLVPLLQWFVKELAK